MFIIVTFVSKFLGFPVLYQCYYLEQSFSKNEKMH